MAVSVAPCGAARAGDSVPLYFGNGCFWGRQKDYVDAERKALGRAPEQVTAVVGYAGGKKTGAPPALLSHFAPFMDKRWATSQLVIDVSLLRAVFACEAWSCLIALAVQGVLTAPGVQGGMGRCATTTARQTACMSAWVRTDALPSCKLLCP